MTQFKLLGEFFLSKELGKKIVNCNGKQVGRLLDMSVRWEGHSPRVTGIKFSKGLQQHIGINEIAHWDSTQLTLKNDLTTVPLLHLQENEIYVGKWLLDKQLIDLTGSKLVRVNDIKLSWIQHDAGQDIVLTAVDVGMKGVFRRLGLEFLVKNQADRLLGWQYIKPLENKTENLKVNINNETLNELHPADVADIIEELDYHERSGIFDTLDNETAAETLSEVELDTQVEIIDAMDNQRASNILREMPTDDAADILGELPEDKSSQILNLMGPEAAHDVRELMEYPDDTAGALMTTDYIAFTTDLTAAEAIDRLRELAPDAETIYVLYVVDENEILKGVFSLRDLIIAQPQQTLSTFMEDRVISVKPYDSHDKVFDRVSKYDLIAIPVIDDQGAILGIITVDDVMDVYYPNRANVDTFSRFARFKGKGWQE